MISPAIVDLRAYRGTPFIDVTDFEGFDYTSATFVMEIRNYRDEPGDPLVALANAISSAEGVSVAVATDAATSIATSSVQIRVNETTIEALRKSNPRGGDVEFVYALDITGGGHDKTRRMRGKFIVTAGENA